MQTFFTFSEIITAWKVSKYGGFYGLYFSAFGLNTKIYFVNLRSLSECGRIWTRKNSVIGYFSRSVWFKSAWLSICWKNSDFWRICNYFFRYLLVIFYVLFATYCSLNLIYIPRRFKATFSKNNFKTEIHVVVCFIDLSTISSTERLREVRQARYTYS